MVMPRSRSRSIESSTCSRIWRGLTVCVISRMRSASVDLPWSMWAMIEKLRMSAWSPMREIRLGAVQARDAARDEVPGGVRLLDPQPQDCAAVDERARRQASAYRDDLGDHRASEQRIEDRPDRVRHDSQQRGGRTHRQDGGGGGAALETPVQLAAGAGGPPRPPRGAGRGRPDD